jgi:glycosyltransferase involved in cell wall biosynthesis
MRIGYLTYGLDRTPTGIGRYAVELVRAMARQAGQHEFVLLSTEYEDRHGLWDAFERVDLSACRLLPSMLSLGNIALSAAIRRHKFDIIHDPNGIVPFFGPAFTARRIATIHDACAYVYPHTHNRLDTWRYHWLLPGAAGRADTILTDSEHSKADLLRFLKLPASKVAVVPCGIGPQFTPIDSVGMQAVLQRYAIRQPYLLYLGGLNARKNIARLFEAYAIVRQQIPELTLVLAGKRQWQTAEMDVALTRFQLQNHVQYLDYVADADLPALYSAARLFVFPSLYEGFGLPPLEAMACGTPVVTSQSSSLPEVVADAALLVDPYDTNALAHAMLRGLTDPTLRQDLRQRGLRQAARFPWERTAREVLVQYQQALEQPAARFENRKRAIL